MQVIKLNKAIAINSRLISGKLSKNLLTKTQTAAEFSAAEDAPVASSQQYWMQGWRGDPADQ